MVETQLLGRDITDKRVLDAFRRVERHRFIDQAFQKDAYGDFPISIGAGQTISQPYMVALMVQLLELAMDDRVLEIGTGSGYETAILSELAGMVFSVERVEKLAKHAMHILEELGYQNVEIKLGDGTLGWKEYAPFSKIVITASFLNAPRPLLEQLASGGRLIMPVGPRFSQRLAVFKKTGEDVFQEDICGCVFVPLIGEYGWEE